MIKRKKGKTRKRRRKKNKKKKKKRRKRKKRRTQNLKSLLMKILQFQKIRKTKLLKQLAQMRLLQIQKMLKVELQPLNREVKQTKLQNQSMKKSQKRNQRHPKKIQDLQSRFLNLIEHQLLINAEFQIDSKKRKKQLSNRFLIQLLNRSQMPITKSIKFLQYLHNKILKKLIILLSSLKKLQYLKLFQQLNHHQLNHTRKLLCLNQKHKILKTLI